MPKGGLDISQRVPGNYYREGLFTKGRSPFVIDSMILRLPSCDGYGHTTGDFFSGKPRRKWNGGLDSVFAGDVGLTCILSFSSPRHVFRRPMLFVVVCQSIRIFPVVVEELQQQQFDIPLSQVTRFKIRLRANIGAHCSMNEIVTCFCQCLRTFAPAFGLS